VKTFRLALVALIPCLIGIGCNSGGTGTGNPAITIASLGYNAGLSSNSLLDSFFPSALASNSLTSLQFCINEMRFITNTGSDISVPQTLLGVVNLGDGSSNVTWGNVNIPGGTIISAVHVELEDESVCQSAGYTIQANGMDVTSELEFHFVFNAPTTIGGDSTFTFALTNLTSEINQALQAGQFNNAQIGNYITSGLEDQAQDN
jgi:hypothetical protein